jgi:hypothetical protein
LLDVEVTVGTVDGVMSLPSVVVVPDPDEVFQLDPVLEGRGGDLLLVVTGFLPLSATGVVPNTIDVDSADSSVINWSSGVIQNGSSVSNRALQAVSSQICLD